MDIYTFYTVAFMAAIFFPWGLYFLAMEGELKPGMKNMCIPFAVTMIVLFIGHASEFTLILGLTVGFSGWALQKECRETILGVVFLPFYMVTYCYLLLRDCVIVESQEDDIEGLKEHWLSWVQ